MRHTELKSRADISKVINEEIKSFNSLIDKPTLYSQGFLIEGKGFNYLNSKTSEFSEKVFRPLIAKIFEELEEVYPSSGDIFLDIVLSTLSSKKYLFNCDHPDDTKFKIIIESLKDLEAQIKFRSKNTHKNDFNTFRMHEISEENRFLIDTLMKNMSITTKVYLEKHMFKKTVLTKTDDITFKVDFDCDFLMKKNKWEAKDYKFVIIDGFIDSVGEIFHLLTQASEDESPYVIFCKGMRSDVKNVILQNLARGTINLMPISLDTNELNVNIIADIAKCHKGEVVNSLMGDTISIAVRRKLSTGSHIIVKNGLFTVKPIASSNEISNHIKYLNKRKEVSEHQVNNDLLDQRIKIMTADKIVINVSTEHLDDIKFCNELKKSLYFIKNSMRGCFETDDLDYFSSCKILPTSAGIKIVKAALSFLEVIYNTKLAVIMK
jgi:hypothetical protein